MSDTKVKKPATPAKRRAVKPKKAGFDVKAILAKAKAVSGKLRRKKDPSAPKKKPRVDIRKSTFYRVYFALLILSVIAIVGGMIWLSGTLKDYESAQPVYVAREVGAMFENGDFNAIYDVDTAAQSLSGGDRAYYIQTMQSVTSGRALKWAEGFSANPDERKYNVSAGSDRFATFTLVHSGETTPRGNAKWKLGTVTTNVVTETQLDEQLGERVAYRITVPDGSTVVVDGETLTSDKIVKSGVKTLPDDFLPKDVRQPEYVQYAFTSRSDAPKIDVTDASGAALTPRADGENAWTCTLEENAQFREQFGGMIEKLAQKMAKFTAADVTESAMRDEAVSESPADDLIRKFDNRWAPTHKYAEFNNMQVSDCIFYSDDCFTCRVTFDFVLRTRKGTEQTYPTAYTFCIVKKGKSAKLYNFLMN